MHNTYGANNYKSTEGLLVWYDQEKETSGTPQVTKIKVTRHAAKRYAFVSMTQSAAASCVEAKRSQYTRAFSTDTFSDGTVTLSTSVKCTSEISSSVNDDGSRDVSISVNETDVHYASVPSGGGFVDDPAALFTTENARDYDDAIVSKTAQGLSYYSSRNRKTTQDLMIVYESTKHVATNIWTEYTRYATKRFAYIGMKQATAEACARAKMVQFMREYSYIKSSESTNAERNKKRVGRGASVALRHKGIFWEVEIYVSETDVKAAAPGTSLATLFADENARNYDDVSHLVLNSVTLDEPEQGETEVDATVSASCSIPEYTLEDCTFQYRVGDSVEWTTAEVEWVGQTGTTTLPVTASDIFCRLTCASTESETIIAE